MLPRPENYPSWCPIVRLCNHMLRCSRHVRQRPILHPRPARSAASPRRLQGCQALYVALALHGSGFTCGWLRLDVAVAGCGFGWLWLAGYGFGWLAMAMNFSRKGFFSLRASTGNLCIFLLFASPPEDGSAPIRTKSIACETQPPWSVDKL